MARRKAAESPCARPRRDNPRIHFEVGKASNTYLARFRRLVALLPIFGRTSSTAAPHQTVTVLALWRKRVEQLAEWAIPGVVKAAPLRMPANIRRNLAADIATELPDATPMQRYVERERRAGEISTECSKTNGRKWRMINCRPAFTSCTPQSRPCMMRTICPSCWARAASLIWQRIDHKMFVVPAEAEARAAFDELAITTRKPLVHNDERGVLLEVNGVMQFPKLLPVPPAEVVAPPTPRLLTSKPLTGFTLITRRISYAFSMDIEQGLEGFLSWRLDTFKPTSKGRRRRKNGIPSRLNESRRLAKLGIVAMLDSTRISMGRTADTPSRSLPSVWHVELRQVMLCPDEQVESVMHNRLVAAPPDHVASAIKVSDVKLTAKPSPTRLDLMKSVAGSLRYTKSLLDAPRDATMDLLDARSSRRLVATYGKWRGASA